MSSKIVLDASALLALLNQEPGHKHVEKYLPFAVMSTINVSESLATLIEIGISKNDGENLISDVIKEIISFDQKQASVVAAMKKDTKTYGLSLGDRACLTLAKLHHLPVLTADKIWAKVNVGVAVEIIR